jgi:3-dehydroquinate dehydratase
MPDVRFHRIFFIGAYSSSVPHRTHLKSIRRRTVQRRTARSCDEAGTTMLGFGQQDFLAAFRNRVQCATQVGE